LPLARCCSAGAGDEPVYDSTSPPTQ
jgi:hypothetical protein